MGLGGGNRESKPSFASFRKGGPTYPAERVLSPNRRVEPSDAASPHCPGHPSAFVLAVGSQVAEHSAANPEPWVKGKHLTRADECVLTYL